MCSLDPPLLCTPTHGVHYFSSNFPSHDPSSHHSKVISTPTLLYNVYQTILRFSFQALHSWQIWYWHSTFNINIQSTSSPAPIISLLTMYTSTGVRMTPSTYFTKFPPQLLSNSTHLFVIFEPFSLRRERVLAELSPRYTNIDICRAFQVSS